MNTNKLTLRLYWQQIRKHKLTFFTMLFFVPLASLLLDTIMPYFLSQAIGTLEQKSSDMLSTFLLYASIAGFTGLLLNLIGYQAAIWHESKVRTLLVNDSLSRLLQKDYSFYARQKIGALTGKFIDFVNAHVGLQDLMIARTLTFVLNITIGTVIIATHSLWLATMVLTLIIVLFVQIKFSLKLRAPLRKERKRLIGEQNGAIADTISNNLTVKTFANESFELGQTNHLTELYRHAYSKDFRWMSIEGTARLGLMTAIQVIAVAVMAQLYLSGNIELGIAVFIVAYLQRIAAQLFSLGEIINGYDRYLLHAAPFTELLFEENKIVDTSGAKDLRVKQGVISFDKISYAYEDSASTNVIRELSLAIPAGQKVGLVGKSGAGKTTLTKALLRFDDITEGAITIDSHDIRSITQQSLRRAISYVPQEPLLFHRSLRENIAYGNLEASDNQIIDAAKKAHAWEFIKDMPQGLDTIVGERGAKLSGGQRQRIAIARAILKDAPILVLDEATSALDSESEKLIQDALEKLMKGRTSIVIAHRLSTIAKLDRIIVMDNGKIKEDGSHEQLLANGGTYAKLWSHQSGGFIED